MSGRVKAVLFLAAWWWLSSTNPTLPGPTVVVAAVLDGGGGVELAAGLGSVGSYSGPASGTLTVDEVAAAAAAAGFRGDDLVTATAVAMAESSGRSCAQGDQHLTSATWGNSVGLFQIRSLNVERGTGGTRDASILCDPATNARSAHTIYAEAGGFGPWSMFTNGRWRNYRPEAAAAVGRL